MHHKKKRKKEKQTTRNFLRTVHKRQSSICTSRRKMSALYYNSKWPFPVYTVNDDNKRRLCCNQMTILIVRILSQAVKCTWTERGKLQRTVFILQNGSCWCSQECAVVSSLPWPLRKAIKQERLTKQWLFATQYKTSNRDKWNHVSKMRQACGATLHFRKALNLEWSSALGHILMLFFFS